MKTSAWKFSLPFLLLLITACSDENAAPQKEKGYLPQISFSIAALKSNFLVDLPITSLTNPCAAVNGAIKACLHLKFDNHATLLMSGAVKADPGNGYCATATLSAEIANSLLKNEVIEAKLELLNQSTSCSSTQPLDLGGNSMGVTKMISATDAANDYTDFHLRLARHHQANLYSSTDARAFHTATLLNDGRLLIAGGLTDDFNVDGKSTASAYVISANGVKSTPVTPMLCARHGHTATLLNDGRVVIAGGRSFGDACTEAQLAQLEIFDPQGNYFEPLLNGIGEPMSFLSPRFGHTATISGRSGDLLFTGGRHSSDANILPADDSLYWLSLQQNFLFRAAAPAGDGYHSATGQQAAIVPGGNMSESLLLMGGITDLSWSTSSYPKNAWALDNFFDPSYVVPIGHVEGIQRLYSTPLQVTDSTFAQVGGLIFAAGLLTLHDSAILWNYRDPLDIAAHPLPMNLATARYGMQSVRYALGTSGSTHLLMGGAEASIVSPLSSAASAALEFVVAKPDSSEYCSYLPTHLDAATGESRPTQLIQERFGHTATQLNDGTIVVIGGFLGLLADAPDSQSFLSPAQLLLSSEWITPVAIPDRCQP